MATGLTWGQIVTLVASNLGKFADGVVDETVATLLPLWATALQTKMMNDRNFWFLRQSGSLPLVAGSAAYPLPPGFSEGVTLYLQFTTPVKAFRELRPLYNKQEAIRLFPPTVDVTDRAEPTHYLIGINQFEVFPTPDQAYTLGADFWGDMTYPTGADPDSGFQNYLIQFFGTLYEAMLTERGFRYLQENADAKIWQDKVTFELADLRARHVARVMGTGHVFRPRTDVYGNAYQNRGDQWVTYFWGS